MSDSEPTSCYVDLLMGVMPSPMKREETQDALVAAAQEAVASGNAISSLFPGDNAMRSSNVNPILIGNTADFAMFNGQHYYFLRRLFPTFLGVRRRNRYVQLHY